jgi:hypothetical protein
MTPANPSEDDIQSKAYDDELNKAEDRIEDHDDEPIERRRPSRQQRGVPSPREIANVIKK